MFWAGVQDTVLPISELKSTPGLLTFSFRIKGIATIIFHRICFFDLWVLLGAFVSVFISLVALETGFKFDGESAELDPSFDGGWRHTDLFLSA